MRIILGLVIALLPITAFAQSAEGPNTPIPVQKCVQATTGRSCTPVRDGAGFGAADGYHRVQGVAAPLSQAMIVPRSAEPAIIR